MLLGRVVLAHLHYLLERALRAFHWDYAWTWSISVYTGTLGARADLASRNEQRPQMHVPRCAFCSWKQVERVLFPNARARNPRKFIHLYCIVHLANYARALFSELEKANQLHTSLHLQLLREMHRGHGFYLHRTMKFTLHYSVIYNDNKVSIFFC